jgi:hydroxymethylglutaryl-CoA lyase
MTSMPSAVTVIEVGPRDGFQMEKQFIPTEMKVAIINTITKAGIRKIEATSFVSPKVIPQLRDSWEVLAAIKREPGVTYLGLVPNLKGAQAAVQAGVDAMKFVVCCTESYNHRNVGMTIAESLADCRRIRELGKTHGKTVEVVLSLAFGCPLEGPIPAERISRLVGDLVSMGLDEISIADSMGFANPLQVRRTMRRLKQEFPSVHFSLHLHNTRGLGLANILAALEEGIDAFDSSIGGLGGSPVVVPDTGGNVSTEDLLNMLSEMGVATGVDIEGILDAARMVQEFLRRTLPSYTLVAGSQKQVFQRIKQRGGD